ncbi:MAG: hypothetical protein A2Y24_02440 [Clostridiales bacterium GWE2_32_10]|nr:MAG: hypothetical protein A2Y24_02440 [Clostridiales bacterium GWE2_32_10]
MSKKEIRRVPGKFAKNMAIVLGVLGIGMLLYSLTGTSMIDIGNTTHRIIEDFKTDKASIVNTIKLNEEDERKQLKQAHMYYEEVELPLDTSKIPVPSVNYDDERKL